VFRRAAWAVLILSCVVSPPVIAREDVFDFVPGWMSTGVHDLGCIDAVVAVTEPCDAVFTKSVYIISSPPNIQVPSEWQLKLCGDIDEIAALLHYNPGRKGDIALCIALINSENLSIVVLARGMMNQPPNVLGRKFSNIRDLDVGNAELGDLFHGVNAEWFNAQIGALQDAGISGLNTNAASSYDPQSDGRDSQDAGKRDKPKGEVRSWIAAGLFPEPVILALLGGALVGCFIVAIAGHGIKERQHHKKPERKKE